MGTNNKPPQLRQASDIMWGLWVDKNPDVANIKYFVTSWIANGETQRILVRAFQKTDPALTPYPGKVFSTATPEGKALLGECD